MKTNNSTIENLLTQFGESKATNVEYWLNCEIATQDITLTGEEREEFINKVEEIWGVFI
jgi:hypothetical protein